MPGVQRSEGWGSTNPETPPQPDWEHKHDEAMLTGVPDHVLEENNRWRPRNVSTAKKNEGKRENDRGHQAKEVRVSSE